MCTMLPGSQLSDDISAPSPMEVLLFPHVGDIVIADGSKHWISIRCHSACHDRRVPRPCADGPLLRVWVCYPVQRHPPLLSSHPLFLLHPGHVPIPHLFYVRL
uniref:Uncharacterized protein n=1 Tax=Cacopsylla melanoneura TaxID=428564 RepID=A0A8D8Y7W4_9HEMI